MKYEQCGKHEAYAVVHGVCPDCAADLRDALAALTRERDSLKTLADRTEAERAELWTRCRDLQGDLITQKAVSAELRAELDALRDQAQRLSMTAGTAMHQPPRDQRNILEDLADRLCAMYATPTAAGDAPLGYMTPAAVAAMPQAQGIVRGSAGDGYSVPVYVRAGDAPTANALRDLIETLEHGDSLKLAEVIERGLEALEGVPAGDAEALDARRYRKWREDWTGAPESPLLYALTDVRTPGALDAAIDAALAADAGRAKTEDK